MMRKLDHYKTRFLEHNKAIHFAQEKKKTIIMQITEFINIAPRFSPSDLRFLEEIAEVVIRARRALTYTYAMRFYIEGGGTKATFFDLMQGDLEASLEKLNKRNEEDWQGYIETDA